MWEMCPSLIRIRDLYRSVLQLAIFKPSSFFGPWQNRLKGGSLARIGHRLCLKLHQFWLWRKSKKEKSSKTLQKIKIWKSEKGKLWNLNVFEKMTKKVFFLLKKFEKTVEQKSCYKLKQSFERKCQIQFHCVSLARLGLVAQPNNALHLHWKKFAGSFIRRH